MAKRMGATTIEVRASHLSLTSQPDATAKLILDAAWRAGLCGRGSTKAQSHCSKKMRKERAQ